jgi:site-specific DNA-methyltransferase (adenine-specific)
VKPYFTDSTGGIRIYHGDCREILPSLKADVVITDPPYGVGLTTKTSDYRQSAHFDSGESLKASTLYEDSPEHVKELIANVIPAALAVADRALIFPGTAMLWEYPRPAALGCVYTPNGAGRNAWGFTCAHPILFYGKDPYLKDGKGSRPNSFRTEQPNREHFDHPCPKPLEWMRWAVLRASRPGETIIDPFVGKRRTLVARPSASRSRNATARLQPRDSRKRYSISHHLQRNPPSQSHLTSETRGAQQMTTEQKLEAGLGVRRRCERTQGARAAKLARARARRPR